MNMKQTLLNDSKSITRLCLLLWLLPSIVLLINVFIFRADVADGFAGGAQSNSFFNELMQRVSIYGVLLVTLMTVSYTVFLALKHRGEGDMYIKLILLSILTPSLSLITTFIFLFVIVSPIQNNFTASKNLGFKSSQFIH
jgi:hypothetical protein